MYNLKKISLRRQTVSEMEGAYFRKWIRLISYTFKITAANMKISKYSFWQHLKLHTGIYYAFFFFHSMMINEWAIIHTQKLFFVPKFDPPTKLASSMVPVRYFKNSPWCFNLFFRIRIPVKYYTDQDLRPHWDLIRFGLRGVKIKLKNKRGCGGLVKRCGGLV